MKRHGAKQIVGTPLTRRQALAGIAAAPVLLSAGALSRPRIVRADEKPADSPDVIVIGAGAIGCNTAWHLLQRGKKVLVLEAQPGAATQSTAGAAGFVAPWSVIHAGNWKKREWEMQRYGIDFYTKLAKRTAGDIGFSPCGITYIYITPEGWQRAQNRIKAARALGTTLEVLTAERAKEVTPFIEFDQVQGIIFDPDAVRVRAGDAIAALAAELATTGVQFKYNTLVTDLLGEDGRVLGVRTADGEIRCDNVVVAAGAWSRPLLKKLDIEVQANPFNETRYVTKPLPGLPPSMPLLIFTDHYGHYIREEKGGLLVGGGDKNPHPADRNIDPAAPPWCDKLPDDQAYRVRGFVKEIANVMPVLADADIEKIRSGVPTRTADGLFIAGPAPDIKGLFLMTGCQEAGVTHGPALGRILSEYVVDGKTHWDTAPYRLERFKA